MLLGNETLTLVHRTALQNGDSYICTLFTGSWYAKSVGNVAANGLQNASTVTVRTEDDVGDIVKGDKVVRGAVGTVDSSAFAALARTHEAMTVTEIHDNRRGLLQHICIVGNG